MLAKSVICASAVALLFASQAFAAEPPLNDSVRTVRELREVALAPDGTKAAEVITASTADGGQTHIWLMSTSGKAARQITTSGAESEPGERGAAWANDGSRLFFLAKRGSEDQAKVFRLFRLPMTGGEAEGLTLGRPATGALKAGWNPTAVPGAPDTVDVNIKTYEVSPDDKWIAVVAEDGDTAARSAREKKKDDPTEVGRDDIKKVRLYLLDAATGQARDVVLPDNVESTRWSPKSDELLVVTAPADDDLGPASRLWRVNAASGSGKALAGVPNTVARPDWTPGGAVFFAQCREDAPPGCGDLYAYDFAGGAVRDLTVGLKGSLGGSYVVDRDGKSVVLPIMVGVEERLARVSLADGAISWIGFPQPLVAAVAAERGGHGWIFVAGGPLQPTTAYFAPKVDAPPVKLAGPALTPADWPATPSRTISWKNGDLGLDGLLYLPNTAAGAKAPLVVLVHGGPVGVWQDRYGNLVHVLLAQGWAVFEPNPRGGLGHGAVFMAANKNDLGGGDYTDIMTGVDAVIASYPVDAGRLALVGYSYGGEMAGFVEGKTDRFKAIVSGAPVIDQFSEYGTEDSSFYDRWYYGKPWEHFADAWRQSPLAGVAAAKTPFLLIQGEDDPTDPLGQSQEMRRALMQVGAPVTLVTYPRETHATLGAGFMGGVTREPWHGLDARRRMITFIADAFTGKPTPAKPLP